MLSIAGYWIKRDEKWKRLRTVAEKHTQWGILAQARISRPSEIAVTTSLSY
ncbi:hypothetical protein Lalb_Chr09g0324271 [Lupinus albus]|uniref:Uncharacterized protein n=1 Tax=Lupinus albus TaxID=3870 RepID=A0A6A4PZP0_LUPAL|nr:hypothetical protein Lalb_Chr09g0324271 [Lupinus albus]